MRRVRYFDEHAFEQGGRLYERLGVRRFRYVASAGEYANRRRRRSEPGFRNVRTYAEAVAWEGRTRFNETVHGLNLLFSVVMMGWLLYRGRYTWLPLILLLTTLLNVYPILLQRYTRARIRRLQALRCHRGLAKTSGGARATRTLSPTPN